MRFNGERLLNVGGIGEGSGGGIDARVASSKNWWTQKKSLASGRQTALGAGIGFGMAY
jgi:hypothetical protein